MPGSGDDAYTVPGGLPRGTLSAAIDAAPAGAVLRLGPGLHEGDLTLTRGIVLEAAGPPGSAVISGDGGVAQAAVTVSGEGCVIRGVRVQNGRRPVLARGRSPNGVATLRVEAGGGLTLEGCDVTCDSSDGQCVVVAGGGRAVLRRSAFQSAWHAVVVAGPRGGERSLIEDCLFSSAAVGVHARDGGAPHVRRCRFEFCTGGGVQVHVASPPHKARHAEVPREAWGAAGDGALIEDCFFTSCGVGVGLMHGADAVVRHNTVRGCYEHGIRVYPLASGLVEHNIVDAAAKAPVLCDVGSAAVVRHNVVRAGDAVACIVVDGGGLFYGNALTPAVPGIEVNGIGRVELVEGPCVVPATDRPAVAAAAGDGGGGVADAR